MLSLKQKTIMIADDDPGIVDAVGMMLEFEGYTVRSTGYGSDVLKLENNFPDLFLLDIWMSGEDGRDICRKLKADDDKKTIPVIMISASKDVRQSAIDAGADDFLAKPFEMNDLMQKIEMLTTKSEQAKLPGANAV